MTVSSKQQLSTHVLDLVAGRPASGMRFKLHRISDDVVQEMGEYETNVDGRTDTPLLNGTDFVSGRYRLTFLVAEYFRAQQNGDAGRFLDVVQIEFLVEEGHAKYHVPLLVSPWSYSTYRGS